MEQTFNLSKLIKFLHQTLIFTEDIKNVLISNCDEATFCLKPWYIEIVSQPETSKNICTCPKFKTEVEEIAASISRTLLQTQQLREKLFTNVTKERNSKCFDMYKCSHKNGNTEQRKVRNLSSINKNTNEVHFNQDHNIKKLITQKMSRDRGLHNEIKNSAHMSEKIKNDNKHLVTRSENKNFLKINKRNIKNIVAVQQYKNINHKLENNSTLNGCITKSKCIKFDERFTAASTSELKSLIQKISTKSNNYVFPNECTIKCSLHGGETLQCIYEQNLIAINVVDSLHISNIPGEIIKSLKVYHTYLNNELSAKLLNGKRQKIFYKFLIEFNKNGQILQEKSIHKNYIIIALPKFTSLFEILFFKNPEIFHLTDIKTTYAELSSTWKMYKFKEFNSIQVLKNIVQKILCTISNAPKWMSNEIWNFFYMKSFEGMSEVYCIRYTNEKQLLLFFDVIEKLQYIQYYKGLVKIVIEDVLPNMKFLFNPAQLEYMKIYKMISILYQDLNPKIPVLVKTDK